MSKFVKRKSKKPCVPETLENCNKKEQAYLEEIKEWDASKLAEARDEFEKQINELETVKTENEELFEKQKDEAMATMKRSEEAKKKLNEFQEKSGYKILILKAKTAPQKEEL